MKKIWFKDYTLDTLNGLRNTNMAGYIGIEFIEIGPDFLKAKMPVDERTKQAFGILHGGASCVLSETLGSVAAWMCINPDVERAVGIEINANHLRSATEGYVTGICRPIKTGRTLHVWQTDIFLNNDKICCTSRLTVSILKK